METNFRAGSVNAYGIDLSKRGSSTQASYADAYTPLDRRKRFVKTGNMLQQQQIQKPNGLFKISCEGSRSRVNTH